MVAPRATVHILQAVQVVYITEGYECQEFNGVFMLAFSDAVAAVHFALMLQQLLMVAEWPELALRLQANAEQQVRLRNVHCVRTWSWAAHKMSAFPLFILSCMDWRC